MGAHETVRTRDEAPVAGFLHPRIHVNSLTRTVEYYHKGLARWSTFMRGLEPLKILGVTV